MFGKGILIKIGQLLLYLERTKSIYDYFFANTYAEVVTFVACNLEAGGLPGYPKSLFVEINVILTK
jgi:hypothetical protein